MKEKSVPKIVVIAIVVILALSVAVLLGYIFFRPEPSALELLPEDGSVGYMQDIPLDTAITAATVSYNLDWEWTDIKVGENSYNFTDRSFAIPGCPVTSETEVTDENRNITWWDGEVMLTAIYSDTINDWRLDSIVNAPYYGDVKEGMSFDEVVEIVGDPVTGQKLNNGYLISYFNNNSPFSVQLLFNNDEILTTITVQNTLATILDW